MRRAQHSAAVRGMLALAFLSAAWLTGAQPSPVSAAGPGTALYILTADNQLTAIVDSLPSQPATPLSVVNLNVGDSLVAIDVRPQNGQLYGLGFNSSASSVQLYHIDINSGVALATPIGIPGGFVDQVGNPVLIGDSNAQFGMDFNPAVDRVRVVNDSSQNFRMNPNTGALIDGDLGLAAPVTGTNMDGAISGLTTVVDATAYTNNSINTSVTTQYTLDSVTNTLYIQSPPNAGTQTSALPVTLNGVALDFTSAGLDIPPGIDVTSSNAPATGEAFAALTVAGSAGLYRINLATGAATLAGGLGGLAVRDLAVFPLAPAGIALNGAGTELLRFRLDQTGTLTAIPIDGVTAGEQLAGIDGRPSTGQLYGLGVNDSANTATLYLIDPQTGDAFPIGPTWSIAFVDGFGNPVNLPAVVTGYGFDFNPATDRVRVVTGSGKSFRIQPNTGAPIDGNLGSASSVPGTNPDGDISGAATTVDATAYTNSHAQLAGQTTVATTQYTLDAFSNQLLIQNPPNSGIQTSGVVVTLNGALLDFTAASGFDIPPGVSVVASNVAASGAGYAALTVGGVAGLYRIDLATGAASLVGALGGTATTIGGLVTWSAPIQASISAASTTVVEADGQIEITVTRSGGAPLAVAYTTGGGTAGGGDYAPVSGTLLLTGSDTSKTISVPLLNDTIAEGNETFDIQLRGPASGPAALTIMIQDNEFAVALPLVIN